MKQYSSVALIVALLLLSGSCDRQHAKSKLCFDDIRKMVAGKTAAEVQEALGHPDTRQTMLLTGERWVWWNYTYLDGSDYPPERRGQVVHLEIVFEKTRESLEDAASELSHLRATDPMSISYTMAGGKS